MKIYNFEQCSPEWFKIRELKMTASHADAIGNAKVGLETYIKEMCQEYFSTAEKENYTNKDLDRGNELEPLAREIYELFNDVIIDQVGFIEFNEYVGCSPDGLIGTDGGWECKSLADKTYFEYLIDSDKGPESKHVWQCQMCMKITGRKWWDLMYYNPNFKDSFKVWRLYPDQEKFDKLETGFQVGEARIKEIISKLNK